MLSRYDFSLSDLLMHIQPTLLKTPVYNLYNLVLLFWSHLVIGGETESTAENIGSYVDSRALYVGICAASAVTLNRDERIRPVYRLHMHGLCILTDGITTRCCGLSLASCQQATISCFDGWAKMGQTL